MIKLFKIAKNAIRSLFSQFLVNTFWHFPISCFSVLLYGNPSKDLILIGVTGTDGKTTTVNLIYHILKTADKKTSMISTVKAVIGDKSYETGFHVTSPHAFMMQKYFKEAVKKNTEYMVIETTSHGLAQHRFTGCKFEIGVLTNITHEHLDYHGTYQEYFNAKISLLRKSQKSILNKDDASYRLIGNDIRDEEITYGMKNADITPRKFPFTSKLSGEFNTYNILASIATAKSLGISDSIIRKGINNFPGIPGRFDVVYDDEFTVIIDFAHTPYSFEQILKAVQDKTKERLIHVFGCAGLRDYKKRQLMGKISSDYSDYIVLTEEDYRTENIEKIFDQIEKGIKGKIPVKRITDRQKAI